MSRQILATTVVSQARMLWTSVTFTLDFEGHGLGVPLVPVVRRQAEKAAPTSYANLKKLLERDG
jgi:hypothetical protein